MQRWTAGCGAPLRCRRPLYRGLADNSLGKPIAPRLRSGLIMLDELGLAPLGAVGSRLLFRIVAAYERSSLGLGSSHRPFDQ